MALKLRSHHRRTALLAVSIVLASLSLLAVLAAPAGAIVTSLGGVTTGYAPRIHSGYNYAGEPTGKPKTYSNPSGNPVLHGENTYVIYWDPDAEYWSEWQNVIDTYMQQAGADSGNIDAVFSVDTQYTDKSNVPANYLQHFKGAYDDFKAYPGSGCTDPNPFELVDQIGRQFGSTTEAVCLTSAQVAAELENFIARQKLPKGLGNVYYLLTPPGVTVCLDAGGSSGHCSSYEPTPESYSHSFCSYHSAINPGGPATGSANSIVYAVVPWTAGGYGDWRLAGADERPGWECQDAGLNPVGAHGGYEIEEAPAETEAQKKEFEKMGPEEKEEYERARAETEILVGPHEQEPNQEKCPNTNGDCDRGLADLIINQMSLQQQDMVTNPLLNAWQDAANFENTDECRFLFGPAKGSPTAEPGSLAGKLYDQTFANAGKYYLNDAFNLAALRLPFPGVPCLHFVNLDPKFTAPNPVSAGEVIGFNGMESDIALDAAIGYSAAGAPQPNYATYTWNFGDGTPIVSGFAPGSPACEEPWLSPCAATLFHSFQYGGTYNVTLTVRDVGGFTATTTQQVSVDGPPAPPPAGPGTTQGGSGPGAGKGGPGSVPAPLAQAVILSHKLSLALRKGVTIGYSVNEQVAGHFELMLPRSQARQLGIAGTPATGMAPGGIPQVVIAKAILVTTKGGHSTLAIKLSKKTVKRLRHLHKLGLTLRLVVHNAAKTPATATVISSATLAG
jgi:hypothetical protein